MENSICEITLGDESLINEFFDCMSGESKALFNRRDYNRRGVLKFLAKGDATRKYWIIKKDGKMAGYVFFLDWNTSIPELGVAVRDDLQGKGLGRKLLEFAISQAKEQGKGGIQLTTHVANLRAQTLYENMGFICKGLCKNGTELFYLLSFR
ncbi:MAG: GNAT family N-acetyltransferase [Clostridia bacterium]|nr:GNAT family N-acetyltransferase [Clostridia bacterium]